MDYWQGDWAPECPLAFAKNASLGLSEKYASKCHFWILHEEQENLQDDSSGMLIFLFHMRDI
jgi:hypothetical protein